MDDLHHRSEREQQVLRALQAEPKVLADIVATVYGELPGDLMKVAALNTTHYLSELVRRGEAQVAGSGWRTRL